MKGRIIAILAGIITAGLVLAGTVAAKSDHSDAFRVNTTLKESEVIEGSYYTAGDTVTIAGTVKGDVYCAGKNIIVSGTVEGDVLCAGMTVKVSGKVDGDVRLAGQFVTLDGTVAKNASLFGSMIDITKSARVGQDLNGAGETINIDGDIARDIVLGGNAVTLTGMVGRNAELASESLTLSDGSTVNGNMHYTSRNEAAIAEGSVKGKVDFTKETEEASADNSSFGASALYMTLAFLFMSLVLVLAAPQLMNNIATIGHKRPGMTVVSGILSLVTVPIIAVLFAITIIGIPLAIVIGLKWGILLLVSGPIAAFWLGRLVIRKYSSNAVVAMMTGALILAILYVIPVVSVIAGIATVILGSGMAVLYAFSISAQKKFGYTIK